MGPAGGSPRRPTSHNSTWVARGVTAPADPPYGILPSPAEQQCDHAEEESGERQADRSGELPVQPRLFIERHPRVYVVEQNRDGQLASLLRLDLPGELVPRLRPVAHIPGLPLDARSVTDEIIAREGR